MLLKQFFTVFKTCEWKIFQFTRAHCKLYVFCSSLKILYKLKASAGIFDRVWNYLLRWQVLNGIFNNTHFVKLFWMIGKLSFLKSKNRKISFKLAILIKLATIQQIQVLFSNHFKITNAPRQIHHRIQEILGTQIPILLPTALKSIIHFLAIKKWTHSKRT